MSPIQFHRKPNKITFICPILLALCLYFAITSDDTAFRTVYWIAAALIAVGFAFHLFTLFEISYELTENEFRVRSRLLLPETVSLQDLVSADYRDETRKSLILTYNKPGYEQLQRAFEAQRAEGDPNIGLWTVEIMRQDINIPLEELKFKLQDIILTGEQKLREKEITSDDETVDQNNP